MTTKELHMHQYPGLQLTKLTRGRNEVHSGSTSMTSVIAASFTVR